MRTDEQNPEDEYATDADAEAYGDDDDYEFDPLGPDEHDAHLLEDDALSAEQTCPECGELTYADSPQCANCGHWISAESGNEHRSLFTGIVVVVVVLAMFLFMAFR